MVDDKFSQVVKKPYKYGREMYAMGIRYVIGCDCSMNRDMPLRIQKEVKKKNQYINSEFRCAGLNVIPNARWSTLESTDFAFSDIPRGGVIGIGTHGSKSGTRDRRLLVHGIKELIIQKHPDVLLVHGSFPDYLKERLPYLPIIKTYDPYFIRGLKQKENL